MESKQSEVQKVFSQNLYQSNQIDHSQSKLDKNLKEKYHSISSQSSSNHVPQEVISLLGTETGQQAKSSTRAPLLTSTFIKIREAC